MSIVTLKLKLWSLLITFFIYKTNIIILAQQPDEFRAFSCGETANYTKDGIYEQNLNTTLAALPTTDSGYGFFNHSTGQVIGNANSIALCRGDVEPDTCRSCLNDSIIKLREVCPNQKEAVGYYEKCLLRYSNQILLGNPEIEYGWYAFNEQEFSDAERFNLAPGSLLEDLIGEAAKGGSLKKFATRDTGTKNNQTIIYGLVQCAPYLSELQCTSCLQTEINKYKELFSAKTGGSYLASTCNFRYETFPFYNTSVISTVPPTSSPSPPVSSPPSPSLSLSPLPSTSQGMYTDSKKGWTLVTLFLFLYYI